VLDLIFFKNYKILFNLKIYLKIYQKIKYLKNTTPFQINDEPRKWSHSVPLEIHFFLHSNINIKLARLLFNSLILYIILTTVLIFGNIYYCSLYLKYI